MRRRPHVRFTARWDDPLGIHPASGERKLILTIPDLPDRTIQQCHGFLRELLYVFEEEYREPLARAYGWAPCSHDDDHDEGPDEEDEDDV